MKLKNTVRTLFILGILVLSGVTAKLTAQTFEEARNLAFSGEREKARDICRQILAVEFNSDVALLLGRTFAWDGLYDSARFVFSNVLVQKPGNTEAFDALSDVEYWSGNYEKAIEYCDEALKINPGAKEFILKKARILRSDEKHVESVSLLEDYLQKNPGSSEFIIKLKEYRPDAMKNSIRLSYTVDLFDAGFNRDPWQITALSYSRKTKLGSVIARVNLADRFGEKGFQYEMDAYPKLGENSYGYLNYGYAEKSLFPKNRFGAEWYQNFPNAWEGSLGMRLLGFKSSKVDIYTATFGKYIGNYWLSLRSFVTPDSDGTSVSGLMLVRRYFTDAENYIGLRLGYGISPDDNRNRINSEQNLTLKTRSVRGEFNRLINQRWIFNAGAVYGGEERLPGKYSAYYTFDMSISRLF